LKKTYGKYKITEYMKKIRILYMFCVFSLSLTLTAACAGKAQDPAQKYPGLENGENEAAQVRQALREIKTSADYVLQPGDLIEIKMFREQDMDRTIRISASGSITYPMVGNVKIGWQTLSCAENLLSEALKKYYLNPSVSILIKEYGNKTVYVLGHVEKPGAIQIPPEKPLTLLEAVTYVGGFSKTAAMSRVKVLRSENGQNVTIEIDVTQITKQGNKAFDIELKPGDIVFVPQSII
jgi:polysaccharide export outer membrane protein